MLYGRLRRAAAVEESPSGLDTRRSPDGTHITCSVGIAANKLVIKMASTNAKPDGMLMIPWRQHAEFVRMMPLRGIPASVRPWRND